MNCQQFTSLIVEVARGQMMDAASRDGAMRHAESCEACAARLAQEQSLTGALRAVAVGMKDSSAPASVEAKLLATFHESLAQQNATTATTDTSRHAPVSLLARANARKPALSRPARRVAYNATAIAASLLLVVLAAALYLRFTRTTTPSLQDTATNNGPTATKASSPDGELTLAAPSPVAPASAPSVEPASKEARQTGRERPDTNRGVKSERATFKHTRTPITIKAQHVIDGGNAIIEASAEETATANSAQRPNEAESVTDFISLVADAPAAPPLESGQLVRVQVPRAALASLGLPLNAERGNEPVKADVLLGGDGLARAIRFVR